MKKVLIVDDDNVVLALVQKRLEQIGGIEVLSATGYKDGVKYLLQHKDDINAAIIDLNLPDVAPGVMADYTTKKGIPTIVLTSTVDNDIKKILLGKDIIDYIIKDGMKGINSAIKGVERILRNYETNVLLVDDSSLQLNIAKKILEKMKLNVITANDGQEALNIINKDEIKFSLVITDYNMPNMDGMELTLKIREKFEKDKLAILVLSANDTPEIPTEFIKIGANDFIYKPYAEIEVVTRVNSNLELMDLFEKTRDMANKDFMTKAYNRRYFFETGEEIFAKAKNENNNLAVAMFDIDKFKSINDTHGHDVGDVAICEVARILNENLRPKDLMARFGGEEFCVLLKDITLGECEELFEKIRAAFESNILKVGDLELKFTTSIGVCYGMESSLEEMIKVSDEGLYYCKNNGRNQVAFNK